MDVADVKRRINRVLDKAEKYEIFPPVSLQLHKAVHDDAVTSYKLEKLLASNSKLSLAIVTRCSQIQDREWSTVSHLPAAIESIGLPRLNSMVMAFEVAKLTI